VSRGVNRDARIAVSAIVAIGVACAGVAAAAVTAVDATSHVLAAGAATSRDVRSHRSALMSRSRPQPKGNLQQPQRQPRGSRRGLKGIDRVPGARVGADVVADVAAVAAVAIRAAAVR
jgi:hypothetical protein